MVLALLSAACSELEVFPERIQLPVSTAGNVTFDARARLRSTRTGTISNEPITWTLASGSGVTFAVSERGRRAAVTVPVGSAAQFKVRLQGGGRSDDLLIDVITPTGDGATAKPDRTPSVLASFGNLGGCPADSTFAFVSRANLGQWDGTCTSDDVIVFSAYRPPMRWTQAWSNGTDAVDASANLGPMDREVRVWLMRNDASATLQSMSSAEASNAVDQRVEPIDDQIIVANGIFVESRVGVRLLRSQPAKQVVSSAVTCNQLLAGIAFDDDMTGNNGGLDLWHPDALNVYVTETVPDGRGEWCWWPNSTIPDHPRNVVRVGLDALMTTLAHEVGHFAGLYVPWGPAYQHTGHVDEFKGFAKDNVMQGGVDLTTTAGRTRLSLGQVFRMHFDVRSNLSDGLRNCSCDPYGGICGRLSRDLRPIAKDKGTLDGPSQACNGP